VSQSLVLLWILAAALRSRAGFFVSPWTDGADGTRRPKNGENPRWVPETSSTSSDQVVFVYQATDASLPLDAELIKIDRFG
jgi:hypothetical protein